MAPLRQQKKTNQTLFVARPTLQDDSVLTLRKCVVIIDASASPSEEGDNNFCLETWQGSEGPETWSIFWRQL